MLSLCLLLSWCTMLLICVSRRAFSIRIYFFFSLRSLHLLGTYRIREQVLTRLRLTHHRFCFYFQSFSSFSSLRILWFHFAASEMFKVYKTTVVANWALMSATNCRVIRIYSNHLKMTFWVPLNILSPNRMLWNTFSNK